MYLMLRLHASLFHVAFTGQLARLDTTAYLFVVLAIYGIL